MSTSDDVIPHAGLIRAVLDGKTVQNYWQGKWQDLKPATRAVQFLLQWNPDDGPVRVKPDSIVRWMVVDLTKNGEVLVGDAQRNRTVAYDDAHESMRDPGVKLAGVLRVELDPETLDVVKAETEKAL